MLVSFEVYQRPGPRPGLSPKPEVRSGAGPWALDPWLKEKAPSPIFISEGEE